MVFLGRGRGKGANRGRGRGVGEVAFESRGAHSSQHSGRDSRQAPESLRITVGNDQFRDRKEDNSGRLSPSVSQRLGPPKDNYEHGRDAVYRREDDMMYRREAEMYGQPERDRLERNRGQDNRDSYSRDPYARPEEREYGDRRGLGGGGYEQVPAEYRAPTSQPLFPSGSRSSPHRSYPATHPAGPSPAQTSTSSRPLKSILKKKDQVPEQKPQDKPSGLPGIANYMDDIEDEDKFLYGGEDDRRNRSERERGESGQYRQPPHGIPIEDLRASNIRSAAQAWQPSAPQTTVTGVVSEFVNAQREYLDHSKQQHFGGGDPFQSQPMQQPGGNDLWSMLAKSVQTAQQQQPPPNQFEPQLGSYQAPFNSQSAEPSYAAQPVQEAQAPAAGHDPTIENILKSIGFDFEMSKRMQEKAKQSSGEIVPQSAKPGDPKFINQTASFIGSQMSHEEMMSTLGTLQREREAQAKAAERQPESLHQNFREVDRDMFSDRDRRGSSEASRGRMNSPSRRMNSPSRRLGSPPKGKSPERLQRGCSPVSAEGSPPPPMFNLPPITIKRRSNFDRKGSPVWDRKSPSRSPQRDSDRSRNRPRSRSPSWNRSLSSHGRKRSRSPARKQSLSPVSPASRTRSRSPSGRKSPVIKRTFNLDDISPVFRRRVSPGARKRSISPGRRRSPGRRSSSRGKSPGRRRSRSPYRKRRGSRSPGRRRSRSPQRHSPSPRGRRRSVSPRGRKRGPSSRSRSRERKLRRSTSRDRSFRGSPGRHRRSSSRDRNRRRSRSRSMNHSRSPRKGRSLSVSSDSDIDGPANKQYFSSPLRLSRSEKQNIPRYYDFPPQQGPPGPPDFNGPPFPGYGPGPGPPPGAFPPGSQPGMMPVCPPGPPMFTMPPPGMAPPVGPPPGFPFPPPGAAGPPGAVFAMPGPPMINQPPPSISTDPEMAPPGTVEMPLNIPSRSNLTDIVNEDSRDSQKTDSSSYKDNRRKERSRSRERRGRSRSRERRDRSRSRERGSQTRSDNRSKDRRGEKKSERSGSSSSNRTVLPPRAKPKAEDIEIKASTTSSERVIVIGGKTTKLQPAEAENKEDSEKERLKILKEKDNMIAKIKALEVEFKNLKQQEFDLKKKSDKDSKPDPILVENKKLLDEIKKEIVKLNKQKSDFESKHSVLLKKEQPQKREIRVTAKKIPSKDDKGKAADKKEKDVFQVEKGKMMKHYFHDGGDHWCKPCNTIHPNIQDYMHHLSSYKHKQTLPNDFRPWMDGYKANDGMILNKKGIRVPLPGIEFMMPVSAYYCQLCKVFLGDVSFGADHFKCESHYINYKKYLAENPIYEKKYKEEREKVLVANKATKKEQKEKLEMKTRQQTKQNNSEKDARIRANEKKWDKNVDDLDDASAGIQKQETNKSQIKLSLKDQKQASDVPEKGFGKFNWTKDKKNEEAKDGDKTPEAGQDKEKGKINFNINLSNKTSKSLIGKTGAQKKNPLLPPWQPVGKKTESVGKPGETANLDQFLTTNNGEGKIPVISEKKRISAREILEAFTGKYKEKEAATAADKEKEAATAADQEKMKGEENVEKSSEKDPELTVKTKKEMKEENEKRMMGIDPDSEVPLAEKKPPPPASQNVPLPDQKPSATVDENAVHKVFNSETIDDDEKPVMVTVTVEKEEIPEQGHVKMEEVAETSQEIKIEVKDENEKMDVKSDVLEIKMDLKCEDSENVSSLALTDTKEDTNIKLKSEENIENGKPDIVKKEESSMIMSETVKADIVPKEEKNIVLEKESVTKVEIIIESNDSTIKEDQESVQMDIEDDKKPKSVEMDMEVDKKQESVQIDIEVAKNQESVQMDIEVDKNTEPGDVKVESGDDISEMAEKKEQSPEIKDESTKPEAVIDDSDTEIDEPVSPAPAQRGRGRGRGKKRGGGRGRGRGKAKAAPARTTRAKRSAKADIEETVEIGESDNVDNSEANDSNKDLELSSSVKVDKTVSGKKKKSASPRVRKSSLKSDAAKADPEEISDIEELKSDASGISMHMDSDFEVLDDLEDLEILDEAL